MTATPPFMASGYFGSNQARRFATLLKETGDAGLFRVVMIHHPPTRDGAGFGRGLSDARQLEAIIARHGAGDTPGSAKSNLDGSKRYTLAGERL